MGCAFIERFSLSADVCQQEENRLTVSLVCGLFALITLVTVVTLVIISKSQVKVTLQDEQSSFTMLIVFVCVSAGRRMFKHWKM